MRIIYLTDLHAFKEPAKLAGSNAPAEPPAGVRTFHPFADLRHLLDDDPPIRADVVLCGGDATNRADAGALGYAWRQINQIGQHVHADVVASVPGNHDLDSHNPLCEDTQEALRDLDPPYPTGRAESSRAFWNDGFAIVRSGEDRIVLWDSCADHVGDDIPERQERAERGVAAHETVELLRERLIQDGDARFNVLVCHHHPLEHDYLFPDYEGAMRNGGYLLQMLAEREGRQWLVLHGHKHVPRLVYAPYGADRPPVIFGGGSMGAKLHDPIFMAAKNQVYLIELDEPREVGRPNVRTRVHGRYRSWVWGYGLGWFPARPDGKGDGLPGHGGFGGRFDLADAVEHLDAALTNAVPFLNQTQVSDLIPELPYLIPADALIFERELMNRDLEIFRSEATGRFHVGRRGA